MKIHNVEQGSAEWFALRMGIPTASEFDKIITPAKGELSKSWRSYAARLIWEALVNEPAATLEGIRHIEEGKRLEPYAVRQFEMVNEVKTERVGFVTTNDGLIGASPDRFILGGKKRPLEVKCPTGPVHMFYMLFGHGDAYKPQVQGQIYVCESENSTFYSYAERAPDYEIVTPRDEGYIGKMVSALDQFNDYLQEGRLKAKSLGIFQAYERTPTPLDKELGEEANKGPPDISNLRDVLPDWAS